MELTAAAAALESLTRPCRVVLHTDSELRAQRHHEVAHGLGAPETGATRPATRWRTWICGAACLDAAKPHAVEWKWVRGHAGDAMNERADVLATRAREGL